MKLKVIFFLILPLAIGCKKHQNPIPEVAAPPAAILLFPAENSACTAADFFSVSQSHVTFSWNAPVEAQSFSLVIKNLAARDSVVENTLFTQVNVTLDRAVPYSWYIISRSSKTSKTAVSPVWKFYNPGNGELSYAPFPAQINAPLFGQTLTAVSGTVNLAWTGVDPDNDILNFDIYFGTVENPPLLKANITESFLTNLPVTSGTTYYWKVITRDKKGNQSDSDHYQFYVK